MAEQAREAALPADQDPGQVDQVEAQAEAQAAEVLLVRVEVLPKVLEIMEPELGTEREWAVSRGSPVRVIQATG